MDPAVDERFIREFLAHRDQLLAYVNRFVANPADAEDVFQRASVVIWRKAAEYDAARGGFFRWISSIAYLEVCNFLRVHGRDRLRFDTELLDVIDRESRDDHDRMLARRHALDQCMDGLRPDERSLVREAYDEDASMTDVAARRNQSLNALYKSLQRIRAKLHACVKRRLGPEEWSR